MKKNEAKEDRVRRWNAHGRAPVFARARPGFDLHFPEAELWRGTRSLYSSQGPQVEMSLLLAMARSSDQDTEGDSSYGLPCIMGNVLNNILTANTGVSFLRSFSMELLILLGGITYRNN
jgi:hypothetical protein